MTDENVTDLAEIDLPFGRQARLKSVEFESGLKMVRLILREGRRITQIDMDQDSANQLGQALMAAGQTKE